MTRARVGGTFNQSPGAACVRSAVIVEVPPGDESTVTDSGPWVWDGSSQDRMLPQSVAVTGAPAQAFVHRPPTSEVQATARPAPYCQADSSGSPSGDTSTTSAPVVPWPGPQT